ncbi:MAG: methionine--tRNA ligase [Candidatus Pacebacteria bacterium]|nr:methionine--tRNA ligase [Candidatus Paceibacterota bacterium]MBP9866785.1 methionine--tRNA ligase [Candidatus Paceibacterota bacterium]
MNNKKFYITTTLPYVNSDPHIGFAMEIVRADVIARYKSLTGCDVFFNTGTDEHGAKIYENACIKNISPQSYVDGYASKFKTLTSDLAIDSVHFIRTTDEKHIEAAKEIWKRCFDNGYIYKKTYQTKYCVGCELNKTDSELDNGVCTLHPNRSIELIDEENYFFKFSEFQKPLLDFYESHPDFVIPSFRFNEIKNFVERGLEDFSISRLKEKMPWGISVPNDDDHVMYVWFDALTSYISTLGFGTDNKDFSFWEEGEPVQYCGKDNLRQQSAMWQAMLMAAGLPNSRHIIINGFITGVDGQKMSKSLGNVISPFDVLDIYKEVTEYPEDVLRFVVLQNLSSFEDGGISLDSIKVSYQANLQNGIGNLTNRIMKLASSHLSEPVNISHLQGIKSFTSSQCDALNTYDIKHFTDEILKDINAIDSSIAELEPFKVIKTDREKGIIMIRTLVESLARVANVYSCVLPHTSKKILECIIENKMPEKPLFNRFVS